MALNFNQSTRTSTQARKQPYQSEEDEDLFGDYDNSETITNNFANTGQARSFENTYDKTVATLVVALDGTGHYASIQEAINALPSTGGVIYIKEGTYNLTSAITINKNNVVLIGAGSSTIITTSQTINLIYASSKSNLIFEKLSFTSTSAAAINAFRIEACTNVHITDCNFTTNKINYGVSTNGICSGVIVDNCYFSSCATSAILFSDVSVYCKAIINYITSCNYGIIAYGSNNAIISNKVYSCTAIGIFSTGTPSTSIYNVILDNEVRSCTGVGIQLGEVLTAPNSCSVSNNLSLSNGTNLLVYGSNHQISHNNTGTTELHSGFKLLDASDFDSKAITNANIDSGTIDATPIGVTTPSTGAFTTISATGDLDMNSNDIKEVASMEVVSDGKIEFRDGEIFIHSNVDGEMTLEADSKINFTAPTDFNSNAMTEVNIDSGTIDGTTITGVTNLANFCRGMKVGNVFGATYPSGATGAANRKKVDFTADYLAVDDMALSAVNVTATYTDGATTGANSLDAAYSNLAGTCAFNNSTAITGTNTTFTTDYKVGDLIYLDVGGGNPQIRRITVITNNTSLTVAAATTGGVLSGKVHQKRNWLSVWVIAKDDGTQASLLSQSSTAPTLPATYTKQRRVGWVRFADTATNVEEFYMITDEGNGRMMFNADIQAAPFLVLNVTTSAVAWTDVLLSNGVPPTSRRAFIGFYCYDGANGTVSISMKNKSNANGVVNSIGNYFRNAGASWVGNNYANGFEEIGCDSAQTIQYASSATTMDVQLNVRGYQDNI